MSSILNPKQVHSAEDKRVLEKKIKKYTSQFYLIRAFTEKSTKVLFNIIIDSIIFIIC